MKLTVFRYGIFASLTILGLGLINLLVIAKKADYDTQEVTGYLTIFISMIFVFLGIRHYRDRVNGGMLSFGQGLKIGVLIVLIPAVFFGLFDLLYTKVINPSWSEEYFSHYVEQATKSTPPEKLDEAIKKLQDQKELFSNPVIEFLIMAATVFVIGFIIAIISTLTLMRKKQHTN